MAKYSHTKIDTFEKCKEKYKLHYIDKVQIEKTKSIETIMGTVVHNTLEKLYKDKMMSKIDTLDEVLEFYEKSWKVECADKKIINNTEYTIEDFCNLGKKCVTDYYEQYKPFDDTTILDVETEKKLELPDGSIYDIRIDRLGCKGNQYYVCDYKTEKKMKTQDDAENDTQLAMYSKWVKDNFPDAESIELDWYMLRFGKVVHVTKTDDEIETIVNDTVAKIKEIENCKEFPPSVGILCDYCEYKQICSAHKHEEKIKDLPPEKFSKDDGVKLVDKLNEIKTKQKETKNILDSLEENKKQIENEIVRFGNEFGYSVVCGTDMKCKIARDDKVTVPDENKKKALEFALDGHNEYLMLSTNAIKSAVNKGEAPKELCDLVSKEENFKVTISKKKGGEHDE